MLLCHNFEYKAEFFDPVDWRPREFNKAADHVANCAIQDEQNVGTLDVTALRDILGCVRAVQVYTDGGFTDGRGAAAMVIVCVRDSAPNFQS